MKPILKKNRQEAAEFNAKKIMITDLCPSEKQKIGQMMMLMQKQKQQITKLQQQLKSQKEDRVIQQQKVEQFKKQAVMLTQRIKQIENKYIQCCRNLDQQKQKVLALQKPATKTVHTQTHHNQKMQTEMQTDSFQIQREQLEQTVMNIINIEDLKNGQEQKLKQSREEHQNIKQRSPSPQFKYQNKYYKSNREIPLLLPKPRRANEESCSNQKKQPSASKLAKEWIKTKKQKINKMKKDILKSERKMIKQLSYTPENTQQNEEIQSDADSEQSNNSQNKSMMEEYLQKIRANLKHQTKVSRLKTEQNRHPNLSLYNPTQIMYSNSRSRKQLQKSQNNRHNNLISGRSNKVDLDQDALNTMLKSKSFRANDVLQNLRGQSGTKRSNHKLKGMYSSDLVDLIQTLGD